MEIRRNHPQIRNKLISHQNKGLNAEQVSSLPEEVIEQIVLRLPVKSLLKFRCVSKSWCSLIGSEQFVKTHLEISIKNTSLTHHRIVTSFLQPNNSIRFCSLRSLLNEPITDSFALDCPMNNRDVSVRVVGCYNGLICILIGGKRFFLWNPSTRMSKKLPDFDESKQGGCIKKYGFGYDESSDDYKVFGVLVWQSSQYKAIGKVYSLKTNSWKIIKEGSGGGPFRGEAGKFASGNLHWGRKFGLTPRWVIDSFDLKSEVYGIVEQPSYAEDNFYPSLAVLGGCLCVLCDYRKIRLDVWVLKQYGVKESWDKLATVSYLCNSWEGPLSTTLFIGPKGEIIFTCGSTFVIYRPKDNKLWHPQITGFQMCREPLVYVESLVSLVPGGDSGEQEMQNQKIVE